jgi:hypothetical protein
MKKVFQHVALLPDQYLGRVDDDGKVYQSLHGPNRPDKYIGRVDLNTGKVYDAQVAVEKYIGRVELDNGKVFLATIGSDEYLGRVEKDGHIFHHKRLAPDQYLGKILDTASFAYGGAAFLLLVLPEYIKDSEPKDKPAPKESGI